MRVAFVTVDDPKAFGTAYAVVSQRMVNLLGRISDLEVITVPGHWPGCRLSVRAHSRFLSSCSASLNAVHNVTIINHLRTIRAMALRPSLFDRATYWAHNAEYFSMRSRMIANGGPSDPLSSAQIALTRVMEKFAVRRCSSVLAMTEQDAGALGRWLRLGGLLEVAQPPVIGSDRPSVAASGDTSDRLSVLYLSSFNWGPKRENGRWFLDEVVPMVRASNIVIRVAGYGSRSLAPVADPRVSIIGMVQDDVELYSSADVVVAPEKQAGGIKVKVLQAGALGRAIVATPQAVEGTGLVHAESCLVAESAGGFAQCIDILANDARLRRSIAISAEETIRRVQDPHHVTRNYASILERIAARNLALMNMVE